MKKSDRELIHKKYNGYCAYCGCLLEKGWHVDELLPVKRGWKNKLIDPAVPGHYARDAKGNYIKEWYMEHPERLVIENQMPACASCNINKHSMTLEEFRSLIEGFMNHLNKLNTQYKIAKRYGLVKEEIKPIVFYFEQCDKK